MAGSDVDAELADGAPSTVAHRAIRGAAWTLLEAWAARGLSLVVFVLLGRLLEPREFGVVAVATIFIELAKLFVESGLNRSLVQTPVLERAHLDSAFWTLSALGFAVGGILALGAPLIASAYDEPQLIPILRLLSLAIPISGLAAVPMALLQRRLEFGSLAARRLVADGVAGVTAVALAVGGAGAYSLVAQVVVGSAVGLVVLWVKVGWVPGLHVSLAHCRQLFGFGASVVGINLLELVRSRGDDALIGSVLGPVALGYYVIAYRILRITTEVLSLAIAKVAFPTFARLSGDLPRLRRSYVSATRMTALASLPVFAGLAVLAPDAITVVFGEKWAPSVTPARILCLGGLGFTITAFGRDLLIGLGKPSWSLLSQAVAIPTIVVFFFIGVEFGVPGVAWAHTVHIYAFLPLQLWFVTRLLSLPPRRQLEPVVHPLIAALAMAAVVAAFRSTVVGGSTGELWRLGASVAVGAVAYLGAIRLIAPDLLSTAVRYGRMVLPGSADRADAADRSVTTG